MLSREHGAQGCDATKLIVAKQLSTKLSYTLQLMPSCEQLTLLCCHWQIHELKTLHDLVGFLINPAFDQQHAVSDETAAEVPVAVLQPSLFILPGH